MKNFAFLFGLFLAAGSTLAPAANPTNGSNAVPWTSPQREMSLVPGRNSCQRHGLSHAIKASCRSGKALMRW